MRVAKLSSFLFFCVCLALINGCGRDLTIQNETQRKRIAELESQSRANELKLEQLQRQVSTSEGRCKTETDALNQKISALEEDLGKKRALISSMQQQLLFGGAQLPIELSTMLEDFAKTQEMVEYDASRGVVRLKSDLLFERGSDVVSPSARAAVESLCKILNSEQAKQFDIIIAGHTDDIPILKPETLQRHPTNWHLSAHRAISVLDIMAKNNIASERLSMRGFGEYRPVVPNQPGGKGNPQNRRVEIFIVPKGV